MKAPVFTGVCTALVTPFWHDTVNEPMLERLIRRQIDAGISAIVVCGTTGESPVLTDHEKLRLYEKAKQYAGDDCVLLAGTGSNSTAHAIALSQAAESAGVDGLLVVSPYYNKATPEGLLVHYAAIAEAVELPVIVYNVPSRTGVDIPVEVYRELSKIPNIAGVKEASTDILKIARTRAACPEDFYVWSGNDDRIVPTMALGGIGVVSVLANVLPEETKAITDAALAGDYPKAAALQLELLPLIDCMFRQVNPIPVKAAMQEIGFDCGECRLPLTPCAPDVRETLREWLCDK